VRWLGRVQGQDLATLYAAADLVVWPAVKEPLGTVCMEAQAAGLPVVGAERRGVAEIVRPRHALERHDLTTAGRAFVDLVEELTSPAAGTRD
jgi:glycosyltransferase involved in cell wall biosynthesis